VTGVTILLTEVVPKQFELLHSVLPKATALAFLYNQTNGGEKPADLPGAARD
jgi:hypothetical protein